MVTRLRNPRNKYGARTVETPDGKFDSGAEARRYQELLILERAGQIADLVRQPKYVLQAAFRDRWGRHWRAIEYTADFAYCDTSDPEKHEWIIEDVKGCITEAFQVRSKLFQWQYGNLKLVIVPA